VSDFATLSDAFASAELWQIIALSLSVSLSATALAALFGLPLGAALVIWRFPGRGAIIVAANALLGLPPVVVGLGLYLLLSHSGPLGRFDLLFTPEAMVIAQAVLALPIVTALAHRAAEESWNAYGDALMDLGASRLRAVPSGSPRRAASAVADRLTESERAMICQSSWLANASDRVAKSLTERSV